MPFHKALDSQTVEGGGGVVATTATTITVGDLMALLPEKARALFTTLASTDDTMEPSGGRRQHPVAAVATAQPTTAGGQEQAPTDAVAFSSREAAAEVLTRAAEGHRLVMAIIASLLCVSEGIDAEAVRSLRVLASSSPAGGSAPDVSTPDQISALLDKAPHYQVSLVLRSESLSSMKTARRNL